MWMLDKVPLTPTCDLFILANFTQFTVVHRAECSDLVHMVQNLVVCMLSISVAVDMTSQSALLYHHLSLQS